MQVKEVIIEKFYNEHQKTSAIAKELGVNPSYVTKVIKKDERYISKKEYRASLSKENRKEAKREWIRNKRQNDNNKQLYEYVKMQNNQVCRELSYSREISDFAFVKWNRGMFRYDKNSSDLFLNKGFKFAFDVPKRVSNVVNTSSIRNKRIYV